MTNIDGEHTCRRLSVCLSVRTPCHAYGKRVLARIKHESKRKMNNEFCFDRNNRWPINGIHQRVLIVHGDSLPETKFNVCIDIHGALLLSFALYIAALELRRVSSIWIGRQRPHTAAVPTKSFRIIWDGREEWLDRERVDVCLCRCARSDGIGVPALAYRAAERGTQCAWTNDVCILYTRFMIHMYV